MNKEIAELKDKEKELAIVKMNYARMEDKYLEEKILKEEMEKKRALLKEELEKKTVKLTEKTKNEKQLEN